MKEKRKSHKLLSLLLCCAVLISMMPMTAGIAAADTGITPIGPDDPEVTITIKNVEAGKPVQDVTYEVKYKDGTMGAQPQGPFLTETGKTPWSVRGTGRYLMKNSGSANYNDKFCVGMTYQLAIAADSIRNISSEKVKLVFEGGSIIVEGNGPRLINGLSNDRSCYMVYVTIPGEKENHTLHVDPSINHVYKMKDDGSSYEEITLSADRNLSYPEGTRLKFAVDQDYSVGADGTLKFLKGFVGKSEDSTYVSSPDSKFLGGNLRVVSRETREIVVQMGDRDASISTEFAKNEGLSKLNVIYLDILPAIENGRRVTVVTPTATEKRGDPKNPADKFATYTITGKTAGEWDPNNGSVYLYKKSTAPNTKTDGNYELSFDLKLNGNYYCSNRSTELFINGRWIPNQYFSEETGSPVYWSIENRKIEALGSSGWEIHITMNDFASQYYAAGSGYGLGLDAPMDFQKNSEGRYHYPVSGGVPANTTVSAYGSTEAASGQSCTVTFPVNVPKGIREWNTNHSGEEQIDFTFLRNATGGVFVQDAAGGSYSSVPATYEVTTDSDGNVTATATFTPENGKLYRVMGSVAATWNGKIVATTPADNSFIYVKGVAKQYLTGSVVYTSAVRYGDDVSIGRTGGLTSIETEKLHYQWQVKSGSEWKDIYRATNGQLPKERIAESLVGKQIRVKVTADGYEGVIYSEAKTVSKATWNQVPVAPNMTCEVNETDTNVLVKLLNKQDNQEYLTSSNTTMTDAALATSSYWGSDISATWQSGNTLYIYTRMKETNTHAAGTIYRYSTIYTGNVVELTGLALEGCTNTIYVKKGEPLSINVVGTPVNANKWSNIYFIEQDNTANNFTVKVDNGDTNYIPAVNGTTTFRDLTITITSNKVGRHTLYAFPAATYNTTSKPFGTWNVVVYEDTVNINDAELIDRPTYADVNMSVGDSYTPKNVNPTIRTNPSGVMDNYSLKWFVMTPATSAVGTPTYNSENTYISVTADGKVTAKAENTAGENSTVALCVADKTTGNFVRHIADYKVTVTAATAPTLESISVVPNEKTLSVGDTVELTAIKYPANATGNITWASSSTGVATVDSSTGKVTAVAEGTTTITAKCGEKQTTCTIHVIAAGHSHEYGAWTKLDDTFHSKTCTANDDTQVAKHNWIEDSSKTNTEASLGHAGEKHYECSDCGATKTDILSQLTAITDAGVSVTAPAYGDTPSGAYTSSGEFNVAGVDWQPAVSGSFAAGTVYTVKIVLETSGSNRFTNTTQFTINGQIATVVGTVPTANVTESVTLTYTFEATGSSGGGGGGGIVPSIQKPEITIIGSGKADLSADGRTATITAEAGNELVSITLNGQEVAKTDKLTDLKTGDKVVITFRKTTDDSTAITKSIASKVSQMQLIARSSKTGKKNIKVTVKGDAKTTALIKDIQDLGGTVKYKFYRSTRKSADYKTKVTKAVPKYLNTTGKKGTMYYYKARVMVYDKAGKLVAQSELKQCKYANRKWSK